MHHFSQLTLLRESHNDGMKQEHVIWVAHADDSALVRTAVRSLIEAEPDMRLAGSYSDAESAILELQTRHADVLVMDMSMPGLGGLSAIAPHTRSRATRQGGGPVRPGPSFLRDGRTAGRSARVFAKASGCVAAHLGDQESRGLPTLDVTGRMHSDGVSR